MKILISILYTAGISLVVNRILKNLYLRMKKFLICILGLSNYN